MATGSIFRNIVIDSVDKAERLADALEEAEKWHKAHTDTKPQRKSRSKYRRGEQIKSIDELSNCKFIYFYHKVYHEGWWKSWQFRQVAYHIRSGNIYKADKIVGDITEHQRY